MTELNVKCPSSSDFEFDAVELSIDWQDSEDEKRKERES